MYCYYLAYGSNLHPERLLERVASAQLKEVVALNGKQLVFHKHGSDDSGKCSLADAAEENQQVYCAAYHMLEAELEILDRYEGGYDRKSVEPHQLSGEFELDIPVYTYIAKPHKVNASLLPYCWYHKLVVAGAHYLQLPEDYIQAINVVESMVDPDEGRRCRNEVLLEKIYGARV